MRCFNCMTEIGSDSDFCPECGAKIVKTNSALQLPIGTVLNGKYEIGQALGEGGFGITYVGYDSTLQMKVAIKEFFPKDIVTRNGLSVECVSSFDDHALYHSEKEKVINEARTLAKFSKTPGIVGVRDYFEANNTAYIVLEYLNGETLQDHISREGKLSTNDAFSMLLPIMQVLEKIHQENIIHRDISPDNMMFDDGELKLLDFGAARQVLFNSSKSLSVMLKHGYAPEEQYRRKGKQGPWTDVYSVCATLYFCITNSLPDTALDRMHEDELVAPSMLNVDITETQEKALLRGLSVLPEDRFQNVNDFISAWNGKDIPLQNTTSDTVFMREEEKTNGLSKETVYGKGDGGLSPDDKRRDVLTADDNKKHKQNKKSKKGIIFGLSTLAVIVIVGVVVIVIMSTNKPSVDATVNEPVTEGENITSDDTSASAENAQSPKTLKDYFDEVDSYVTQKQYTEALATLDTASRKFDNDSEIEKKRIEVNKSKITDKLSEFDSSNDIEGAIKYLSAEIEAVDDDEELTTKLNIYKSNYRDSTVVQADAALKESGYEAALQIVNASLNTLPNDATLLAKIQEYNEYKPVDLSTCKRIDDNWNVEAEHSGKDSKGNSVNDAWIIRTYSSTQSAEIYVGRKYSTLEFDILPSDSFSIDSSVYSTVRIYADDVLVYTSPSINYKSNSIHAQVNINYAEYIRIEGNGTKSDECAYTYLVNANVHK